MARAEKTSLRLNFAQRLYEKFVDVVRIGASHSQLSFATLLREVLDVPDGEIPLSELAQLGIGDSHSFVVEHYRQYFYEWQMKVMSTLLKKHWTGVQQSEDHGTDFGERVQKALQVLIARKQGGNTRAEQLKKQKAEKLKQIEEAEKVLSPDTPKHNLSKKISIKLDLQPSYVIRARGSSSRKKKE